MLPIVPNVTAPQYVKLVPKLITQIMDNVLLAPKDVKPVLLQNVLPVW